MNVQVIEKFEALLAIGKLWKSELPNPDEPNSGYCAASVYWDRIQLREHHKRTLTRGSIRIGAEFILSNKET